MGRPTGRGKRYETTLRVGSLANLAVVGARLQRPLRTAREEITPFAAGVAPKPGARPEDERSEGGRSTWQNSWR